MSRIAQAQSIARAGPSKVLAAEGDDEDVVRLCEIAGQGVLLTV